MGAHAPLLCRAKIEKSCHSIHFRVYVLSVRSTHSCTYVAECDDVAQNTTYTDESSKAFAAPATESTITIPIAEMGAVDIFDSE